MANVESDIDKGLFVDRSTADAESFRLSAIENKRFAELRISVVTSTYLAT